MRGEDDGPQGTMGRGPDYHRLAEDAITEIGMSLCPQAWKDGLLNGNYGDTLSKMRLYAKFLSVGKTLLPLQCSKSSGVTAFDFRAEAKGNGCWVAVCTPHEMRFLTDKKQSVMIPGRDNHGKQSAGITSEKIVEMARACLASVTVRDEQAILAIIDTPDMIDGYGGLDDAMGAIAEEIGWLSAVVLVHAGSCDIRDVRGTANPLSAMIRERIMDACEAPAGR